MEKNLDYKSARDLLLNIIIPVDSIEVPLEKCAGRIIAQDILASEDVPAFDRSPYDGYAFCALDSAGATPDNPAVLQVAGEIAAGEAAGMRVERGTAVKIMTGAPIPAGADAVVMYEKTDYTESKVSVKYEMTSGENIIYAGEDMKRGGKLAEQGTVIDPGLAGSLAAQAVFAPLVYRRPEIGVIVTGNEVVDGNGDIPAGKIRNTNRYILSAELERMGCIPVYYGISGDSVEEIAELINKSIDECDAVLVTGGVSAGKYDLTPAAMEKADVNILVKNVKMKPGMACAYGVKNKKIVCGLSGNPAACITNFYAVVKPAIRKLSGMKDYMLKETRVILTDFFPKKSRVTRILRGRADFSEGIVKMDIPCSQGNVVISSSISCNILAEVPAGSGPLKAGTILKGFWIGC